ncbi:Glycine/D-amino acid oxidase [Kaistia soli DSM 19436]|uniref:Glycine/D-amino acid oxidase n=1 Tax=Kaistia soli DSM 19436 TaxID=1122133 RepID=A0A1M5KCZ6_9HYPH|nr:FAD-binding oxidoreductase [Kaistia soli]SHG50615.1 Glycine/D-amino acid oxidase [Kaistia soli DSM 19436]
MFDPETKDQADLREGMPPWRSDLALPPLQSVIGNLRCDVLIVGAGITGALAAEHLTSLGRSVIVLDRERPGRGSTLASTAMLLWEIDRPLSELADLYGFERAGNIYRQSFEAVAGLAGLVSTLGLPCQFRRRPSLYLAAGDIGAAALAAELQLRARAGLPGRLLGHLDLLREYGIDREAAILSPGSFDADPLLLANGLAGIAARRGATFLSGEATSYDSYGKGVLVGLDNGFEIEAGRVVLATGYVMPDFVQSDLYTANASFAVATPVQQPGLLWRDEALIWEASDDYLYARTTADGRVVIGGEDEEGMTERAEREAVAPQKTAGLMKKLAALQPDLDARAEMTWSGVFGTTEDGLPLIGEVPGKPGIFAAYGYGGNGITFSFLASRLIGRMIAGEPEPWFDDLAIDRPRP